MESVLTLDCLDHGITHGQAWGITAMSLWIGINVADATNSLLPLAVPVLTLAMFATFAQWAQDQSSGDGPGDDGEAGP